MAAPHPLSNAEIVDVRRFYLEANAAYQAALRAVSDVPPVWIDLGGSILRLEFACAAMLVNIKPALAHLVVAPQARADLVIGIWDSASTGVRMPPPPWSSSDYVARGEIRNHSGSDGIDVAYHPGSGVLSLYHSEERMALLWMHDARRCPYWEQAAPLRTILHWWYCAHGQQLVHGAAVGTGDGCVLLTGKGGSGKSTTALAALLAGMDYMGDDYVLCDMKSDVPQIHSLYNSAKLDRYALQRLPALSDKVHNQTRLAEEKAVLFTHDHFSHQVRRTRELKAIVIPRVGERETSRVLRLRPALAFLAISPTTVFQLPGAGESSLALLKRLVEQLPCFRLELGNDPLQAAALIGQLIAQLR